MKRRVLTVIGFHARHYNVVVPIACCAGHLRGPRMLERQMEEPAYNYTVAVTHAYLITFW